jgi:hypothetical protein
MCYLGGLFDEIHSDMTSGDIFKTIVGTFVGTIFYSVLIGLCAGKKYIIIQPFYVLFCLENYIF